MWLVPLITLALAQTEGAIKIEVEVDKTVEVDVGFSIGVHCDDLSFMTVEMRAKSNTSNVLVIKGIKPGATLCSVGSALQPITLFDVQVIPKKP